MKVNKRKLIVGFGVFALLMLLALLVGVGWETNDDPAIAGLLSGGVEAGNIYQQKWLVIVLSKLFGIASSVNWWLVFSILVVSGACACICSRIEGRIKDNVLLAVVLSVIVFFVYRLLIAKINFTKTAAICIAAANVYILDTFGLGRKKIKYVYLAVALAFYLLGAAIRTEAALLGLPFLGLSVCWVVYFDIRNGNKVIIKEVVCRLVCCLLLFCSIIASSKISTLMRSDAELAYLHYNTERAKVQDYAWEYPSPVENPQIYMENGHIPNDARAILSWIDNDSELITAETFTDLSRLKNSRGLTSLPRDFIASIANIIYDFEAFGFLLCVLLVALVWILSRPIDNGIKVLAYFGTFMAMLTYFHWSGRLPARVIESCLLLCSGSFLLTPSWYDGGAIEKQLSRVINVIRIILSIFLVAFVLSLFSSHGKRFKICAAAASLVIAPCLTLNAEKCKRYYKKCKGAFHRRFPAVAAVCLLLICGAAGLLGWGKVYPVYATRGGISEQGQWELDYINSDKTRIFILPVVSLHGSVEECMGPWRMAAKDYCSNTVGLGGWGSRCPGALNNQEKIGIENPMSALVLDPRVYSVEDSSGTTEIIVEYLRTHYDETTTQTRLDQWDDRWLVRYQGQILPNLVPGTDTFQLVSASVEENYLIINGITDYQGDTLYCNVEESGDLRTYVLSSENGIVDNQLYEIDAEDVKQIDSVTFYCEDNGRYVLLSRIEGSEILNAVNN